MGKDNILGIDDLLADEDETTAEGSNKSLYDLVIPPGLSVTMIQELILEFGLESHTKNVLTAVEDGEPFEMKLIVLRGDYETVERANKYLWDVIDDRTGYFED
ncbi:MAG: hypothetical protein KAR25_04165 [Methanosarcinales archaeon]|nr:hypothetical protein [Methanosarcinales archaeon]